MKTTWIIVLSCPTLFRPALFCATSNPSAVSLYKTDALFFSLLFFVDYQAFF